MLSWLENNLSSNKKVILLFCILGFLVYANSLPNKMFWDDEDNILKNAFVQDWQYFGKYFSENVVAGRGIISNYWRPVILTFWSIEWKLFGDWAPGYHFIHMVLHILNGVLLFYFLESLFKKRFVAIFISIIFLLHPLQTEAITYASGTSDPLSGAFILTALIFFIKYRKTKNTKHFLVSLGMYPLALMSRETAIVMPAYFVLIDFVLGLEESKNRTFMRMFRESVKTIWPFLIIAFAYLGARATFLNFENTFNLYGEDNELTQNFHFRLFTFLRVLSEYFELMIFPHNLHMERVIEIEKSLFAPRVIIGAILGLASLAFTAIYWRKYPLVVFGILWFLISLFPTSNLLIPINGLMYEHWMYFPLIGFFLALTVFILSLVKEIKILRSVGLIIVACWLVFLTGKTLIRNSEWKDPITFYNQTLQYAPNSYRIINNLGMAYADNRQHSEALEKYNQAISLDPQNPVAYHNLGNTYKELGKQPEAVENFEKALSLNPQFFFSYNALAQIYISSKDYTNARKVFERHLPHTQDKLGVLMTLSQFAYEEKDYDGAISYLKQAQEIIPGDLNIRQNITFLENLKKQK